MADEGAAAVYGELYRSAETQMQLIGQAILSRRGKGFSSTKECAKWAHENLLDMVVLGKAQHCFYHVTHYGEIITAKAFKDYYCKDVLFISWTDSEGVEHVRPWLPDGFEYYDRARIVGEQADGVRAPLYHRNYFTPTGYYDMTTGSFNVAKAFSIHARDTGRDTSHIYEYIQHVAGECNMHLLAWLRMKMMYPTVKTQVVPVIVSKEQGNGKTTFAEVICKGLFGKDNVLVTDQYDSNSRFNADYADALIVCHEEKEYDDRRSSTAALKSRATATTIRKEHKGLDPIYQESYTDFILTSNKDVPVKFDDLTDQRRFMVMEADGKFTRKSSKIADEIFSKLYGKDAEGNVTGVPFAEDKDLIAQFKHELYTNEQIASTKLRDFPKTDAYERCFALPRTNENTDIEAILKALAPFIKEALVTKQMPQFIQAPNGETVQLGDIVATTKAVQFLPAYKNLPPHVALCRSLVFQDHNSKPFQHANVERGLQDLRSWLLTEYQIQYIPDMSPVPGGFVGIAGRYRMGTVARFALLSDIRPTNIATPIHKIETLEAPPRVGFRLRVNDRWQPDPDGQFETVNEMKPGVCSLKNKNENVQYMDTFLFEADDTSKANFMMEEQRLKTAVRAEEVFYERLRLQRTEGTRLFNAGIVARIVYSGGKSYHMLVRVKDQPETIDEYKWLHGYLCSTLSDKLDFDVTCNDPARLTRAPVTVERTFEYHGFTLKGKQLLVNENWAAVYDIAWRVLYEQWLNRPLTPYESAHKRKLMPVKAEYRDAMNALLEGTFWTDKRWDGCRQQMFFPGYRLCRILGYTHDELWGSNGILDGLSSYYRSNEITYWQTRESSDIIKQIDEDVDNAE